MADKMINENNHKIAFIICVNDEAEFCETLAYIENLVVPKGYETDIIAVREATSMAAGYNAAMQSTDAKYKIYIHQDVFLIYKNLLEELIAIFEGDEGIGMVGILGCRVLPQNAHVISRWDTGRTLYNGLRGYYHGYQKEECVVDVMAIDGMFMATQTDVLWREDIFDGWDFYDISQCGEFLRQGKRIVVPYQKEYWIYHDDKESSLKLFDYYRMKFIQAYQDIYPFKKETDSPFTKREEYEKIKEKAKSMMEELISAGEIEEVCKMFSASDNQGYAMLRELELICRIYRCEIEKNSKNRLYCRGMSCVEVETRFHHLRHLIKRIMFEMGKYEANAVELIQNYSVYAVAIALDAYEQEKTYETIRKVYQTYDAANYNVFLQYEKGIGKEQECSPIEGKKTLIILRTLPENARDEIGVTYLVENGNENYKKRLKNSEILCKTVVRFIAEEQDRLYYKYKKVIIFGNEWEEYVKIFYNTDIPVYWYTNNHFQGNIHYGKNIYIQDTLE